MFESGWSVVSLSVLNPSARILDEVELTLHLDGEWSATDPTSDELEEMAQLPDLPKLRNFAGLIAKAPFGSSLGFGPIPIPRVPYFNPSIHIEPQAITLQLGQLRPEKPRQAPDFWLILHRIPEPPERFQIPRSATSTSTVGLQRGVLEVPVETRRFVLLETDYGIPADGGPQR